MTMSITSTSAAPSRALRPLAPVAPARIVRAIEAVQRGLRWLIRKLAPPQLALLDIVSGKWRAHAIQTITELGIPELMADGPRGVSGLAGQAGVDEAALGRLLRALASDGILKHHRDGRFGLTALSRPLLPDHPDSMNSMIRSLGSEAATRSWAGLTESVRTGEAAWHGDHDQDFWEYLADNPEAAAAFDGGMTELTRQVAPAVARAFDFGQYDTVVDLGGGAGELLATVLRQHRDLAGICFDRARAFRRAPAVFDAHGVADRARLMAGDVLRSVPGGHGCYVAKNVVHGMDDETMRQALRHWRSAMREEGRLVLVEVVVPEGDGPYMQFLDLQMLVATGGRERTRSEFDAAFRAVGLRLESVTPLGGPMSVIVARPARG